MSAQAFEALIERHKRVQCLYKCVNLNLAVALSGDKGLAKEISEIEELLNDAYQQHDNNNQRFHSFVVSHYFISLVSEFEGFLLDLMRVVIKRYPSKIGNISLRLCDVAECETIDQAIEIGASKFLNELIYQRPKEYIASISEILSIPKSPELNDLWKKFVECKARRDLGVHNDWKTNETYNRKVMEIGGKPSHDKYVAPTNDYFVNSVDVVHSLMTTLTKHCADKFAAEDVE